MSKLPIYKYLDISTAHIKEETDTYLQKQVRNDNSPLIVYEKECGYFIHVSYNLDEIEMHIPSDLASCLGFARKHNCYWIVLDRDAEVIDELETYEW